MATANQAIIRSGGKQYRVVPGQRLRVDKIDAEVGSSLELTDILLVGDGESAKVGTPVVAGAKVAAKVARQVRGKKVIVFKYKRRNKMARRRAGHRQYYTELLIESISA